MKCYEIEENNTFHLVSTLVMNTIKRPTLMLNNTLMLNTFDLYELCSFATEIY